uniref:Protein-serine/threonine phosphatase n=1 Tax=Arcella intermedia TaxID=1963864 RepID=A0A6B2LIA2_9EUKA
MRVLQEAGASHVLDLTVHQKDSSALNVAYLALYDTDEGKKLVYLNLECVDTSAFDIASVFGPAFEFISRGRRAGRGVLVHCEAGISRSASVVMAYLVETGACATMKDAYEHVSRCRPQVQPNLGFALQLFEWEKEKLGLLEISDFYYDYVLSVHHLTGKFTAGQLKEASRGAQNIFEALMTLLNKEPNEKLSVPLN